MKNMIPKRKNLNKGAPSGFVISLVFHAVAFFIAGLFVVFTVLPKEKPKFEPPPPVERPKMRLKKPKVKIKKSSQPKPSSRIVAKVKTAKMPEIQLPDLVGAGEGLMGGMGMGDEFMDIPDFTTTIFGSELSTGSDFIGTFYDTKRDRDGSDNLWTVLDGGVWRDLLSEFFRRDWDFSIFDKYYRSSKKLYATSFVVPATQSGLAPAAFGDPGACGGLWMVHYKGLLVCPASHTNGITFRFWAVADEFMVVKVDGKINLAMDWRRGKITGKIIDQIGWRSSSAKSRNYYKIGTAAEIGDWITLQPGESLEMEMITGGNGGVDHHALMVEEEGVEYEHTARGGPILPAFRTAKLTHDQLDLIYKDLPEEELCLTNGPIFNDYAVSKRSAYGPKGETKSEPYVADEPVNPLRTWSLADGRTFEAAYEKVLFDAVVLRDSTDREIKVPLDRFSPKDADYIELLNPPSFDIDIMNGLKSVDFNGGFFDYYFWYVYPELHGHFGVRLKQRSSEDYNHDIQVEMFVVGRQISENPFILLDYQKFVYNPGKAKYQKVEFESKRKVMLQDYPDYYEHTWHGEKYVSYAVILTDELGRTIGAKSPKKWLIENVDKLRELKPGNYFDNTCNRIFPARPPLIPLEKILIKDHGGP